MAESFQVPLALSRQELGLLLANLSWWQDEFDQEDAKSHEAELDEAHLELARVLREQIVAAIGAQQARILEREADELFLRATTSTNPLARWPSRKQPRH